MRSLHALPAAALVALAACSSGGDTADTPATEPAAESVPAEEPVATDPVDDAPVATEVEEDESAIDDGPAESDPDDAEPTDTEVDEVVDDEASEGGYDFSSIAPVVDDFLAESGLSGVGMIVVDREDGVVFEEHWGDFTADRVSLIASSSKMITAGVLLHLDDQGLLDIDAPVADYLDWGDGNPTVTVAQMISNSSGLVGLGPNVGYAPYLCQFIGTELEACGSEVFTTPDDDADVIAPDTEFRYGGAQWQVAGAVAEAVSGKPWAQLIDEIYVQPCGLDALGYSNHFAAFSDLDEFGYPTAFGADVSTLPETENPSMEGGAYTDTSDYGELLLMHLRGGMCGDTQVLSQEALDAMHADRVADVYGGDAGEPDTGYGMGWWVDRPSGIISDGGLYGSFPWLDLEDGYGAFFVIEANGNLSGQLREQLIPLLDDAMTAGG